MFYKKLQQRFDTLIQEQGLAQQEVRIEARILTSEEALGNPSRDDYPLLKGKEFLMEAHCLGMVGQAYTDAPSNQTSTLERIASSDLSSTEQRALFVATLNAVMRYLYPELKTIHCRNDEPERCAEQIVAATVPLEPRKIGLVGLQPAILDALVEQWGSDTIHCIDRDNDRRGSNQSGVTIQWGDQAGAEKLFSLCDLILATGSTVVNGSLPELLTLAETKRKPIYFYGTSIAGTARLMQLSHLCFEAS